MSEATSESSGTTSNPASEGSPVTETDILVAGSSSDELLAVGVKEGELPLLPGPSVEASIPVASGGDKLDLADVLPGHASDPNLGAFLTVETVGGDTVISIDADDAGSAAPVQVVTLEGITGVTLQELLINSQMIG